MFCRMLDCLTAQLCCFTPGIYDEDPEILTLGYSDFGEQ